MSNFNWVFKSRVLDWNNAVPVGRIYSGNAYVNPIHFISLTGVSVDKMLYKSLCYADEWAPEGMEIQAQKEVHMKFLQPGYAIPMSHFQGASISILNDGGTVFFVWGEIET